ncbi:MAG: extracellular solute-binding protein [Desulfurococcaceae archaeon]
MKPFEEKYNVEIVLISGTTSERYTKLTNKVEPIPDVVFFPDYYTYMAADKGFLIKINLSKISNYNDIYPFIRNQLPEYVKYYGVPHTIQDLGIAYRSDLHPPVTSWRDIWRDDFKGKIIWPVMTATSGPMALVMTSLAYTGELYNVEAAFNYLVDLKPYIVAYYTRSGDPQLYMERGEAELTPVLRYNWGPLKNLTLPIGIVCPNEGSVFVLNMISIVNGTSNADLAYEFINHWISEESQRRLAESLVDAPINSKVLLPAGHPFDISCVYSKPIYLDPKILAENLGEWVEKWRNLMG